MKTFDHRDPLNLAIEYFMKHGFVLIEGSMSIATSYANQLIASMESETSVSPCIGYQNVEHNGYFYYVFDCQRYSIGDRKLPELIRRFDCTI